MGLSTVGSRVKTRIFQTSKTRCSRHGTRVVLNNSTTPIGGIDIEHKSMMLGVLMLLLAVSAASADNRIYFDPHPLYIPECGNATVQLLLNATDRVDTWSTMIGFDNESVNITDVDFTGGITPTNASWGYHGDHIYLGGVSLDNGTGDELLLATLTVECNGSCGEVSLSVMGEENVERLIAGPPDGDPPHGTIHAATWVNGTAQCVDCGDVNCKDGVDAADYFLLRAYVLGAPVTVDTWAADVNCKDGIDAADYFLLRAYVLGAPVTVDTWAADVNCKDGIDAADYFLLRAYVLGAPVELECCGPPQ